MFSIFSVSFSASPQTLQFIQHPVYERKVKKKKLKWSVFFNVFEENPNLNASQLLKNSKILLTRPKRQKILFPRVNTKEKFNEFFPYGLNYISKSYILFPLQIITSE